MILCVCDRYLLMLLMQGKKEKADEAFMQFRFPRRTIAHRDAVFRTSFCPSGNSICPADGGQCSRP